MSRNFLSAAAPVLLLVAAASAHAQARLALLDAGAEPRQPIRYQLQPGRSERAQMDLQVQMALSFGGQTLPLAATPPVRMNLELTSSEVATDGSARIRFVLSSIEAIGEGPQVTQANQSLSSIKGLSGWYRMDARGNVLESHVDPASNANDTTRAVLQDLEQSMQRISTPFPEQAVGQGARWQVTQDVNNNGVQMSQTAEFTLRSRSNNRLELEVRYVDVNFDSVPNLPAGAKLDSARISGGGTTSLPLDRLGPRASSAAVIDLGLAITAEGQTQALGMNLGIQQAVEPAD
nr:MAG: hypothetical protein DIU62_15395 [Pseudomonadota bacterium]